MAPISILFTVTPAVSPSNTEPSLCAESAHSSLGGTKVGALPQQDCHARSMSTESLQVSASSLSLDALPSFTGTEDADNNTASINFIDAPVSPEPISSPEASLSSKKSVQFACSSTDKVNFVLSRKQLSYKERNKTWWTQADFEYLRRMQREITNAAIRTNSGKVLSNAFPVEPVQEDQVLKEQHSGGNTTSDGMYCNNQPKMVQSLVHWYKEDIGRRGLERLCCPVHKKERLKARQRVVSYVMKNQNMDSKENFAKGYEALTR